MRTYCLRSFISMSHSSDYNREHAHNHTVEVAVFFKYQNSEISIKRFDDLKEVVDVCYKPYQGCYLNDLEGFEEQVSIEYLGEKLFFQINDRLNDNGMFLEKIEIGETPLRTYIVTRTV